MCCAKLPSNWGSHSWAHPSKARSKAKNIAAHWRRWRRNMSTRSSSVIKQKTSPTGSLLLICCGRPSCQRSSLSASILKLGRSWRIAELAIQQRLPTMFIFKTYVEAGGLMSYGVNAQANYRQLGFYAAKILNGAKPADLPVQQAVQFELVINLKTAKAIGVEVSTAVQLRADEVIE